MREYRMPPGWSKQVKRDGNTVFSRYGGPLVQVARPGKHWFIFVNGVQGSQPYRTWIDAVRDAGKEKA